MPRYFIRSLAWVVLISGIASTAIAQDAAFVSRYAARDAVTGADTVFLLAIGNGMLSPDARFSSAAVEQAALPEVERYTSDEPLALAEFSFLVTTYFRVNPSLMGRLFPSPRYAVRDLRRERILFYEADAGSPVPGDVALRVIGRAVRWSESR